jgi:hypothetical protein
MKTTLRIFTAILLLINGLGAVFGGFNLILYPDGGSLQMSVGWLEHSAFKNYLIPGILLLVFNGLFSLFVLIWLILGQRHYALLVVLQGAILTAWIIIQMIMLRSAIGIQILFLSIGLLLLIAGWLLKMKFSQINQTRST